MEKGNFILPKYINISVKNRYGFQNNDQLNKTHLSVTTFSLSNADICTLTPLTHCKPVSDCINVLSHKSVQNSFIKPVHKPFYISSIKPVPVKVRKFSIYNSSLGAKNECVHVSVNNTSCKASVTHFSKCVTNVHYKVFKVVLPSLSVNTVSVPPVNVVKVITTSIYQYTNPTSKHAVVPKSVFSISHVNTYPAPAGATLSSHLSLHACDVIMSCL